MAKGTGTYDDPIIVDGIFSKTINGVKKFFKLNTGSKQSSEPSIDTDAFVKYTNSNLQGNHNVRYVDLSQDANAVISTNWYKSSLTLMTNSINNSQGDRRDLGTSLTLYGYGHRYYPARCRITANNPDTKDSSTFEVNATQLLWNNKFLVTSVNGKNADDKGNVKLNVVPEVDYSKASTPTNKSYSIDKAGLLYIDFSSQNKSATVSLKVNNIEVYSFKPVTANLTNVKTLCGIVKKGDIVSITSSNAVSAKWYTCDFITA